jgi:hypothetical protein
MSFFSDGFLSSEFLNITKNKTEKFGKLFDFSYRLNNLAMKICNTLPNGDNEAQLLITLLFKRIVSNYQGALILIERGMTVEGKILVRSALESLFYMMALHKAPKLVDDFLVQNDVSKKTLGEALVKFWKDNQRANNESVTEVEASVREYDESTKGKKKETIKSIAKTADLIDLYDKFYNDLSNQAAHPRIDALNNHFNEFSDKNIFYKIEEKSILDAIYYSWDIFINALFCIGHIKNLPADLEDEIRSLFDEYKLLRRETN